MDEVRRVVERLRVSREKVGLSCGKVRKSCGRCVHNWELWTTGVGVDTRGWGRVRRVAHVVTAVTTSLPSYRRGAAGAARLRQYARMAASSRKLSAGSQVSSAAAKPFQRTRYS